ncbi:MAG: family 43 glycosylhydrolase [Candidatus Eisenbacteria bacterium]
MARFISLIAAILISACPGVASGLVKIDFDQRYCHEPSFVMKDHAFFKADSVFHLFYTRTPLHYQQYVMASDDIGHATSTDLKHWSFHSPAVAVSAGQWDGGAIWAPFVMEKPGGGYIMFYTGVDSNAVQRIGIATSEDLFAWTKYANNPVYRPDTSWAAWDSTVQWSSCRDPHIYFEEGVYYLLTTATAKGNYGAVGSAVSSDLFNWTDDGPIYVHSGTNAWHAIESCYLMKRGTKYRLFFSEEDTPAGISYMASDSMYSGWDIATRLIVNPGLGVAPEILNDGGTELLSRFGRFERQDSVNTAVKFDTLRWIDDVPSTYGPHSLSDKWKVISGSAVFYQPTFGDNALEREAAPAQHVGNSWIGTLEYCQGPLQSGWSGWTVGENAYGYLRSYPFVIEADSISLLVGGGNHLDSAFVGLYRVSDDSLLFRETGRNIETMDRRVWHVRPFKGDSVYLKIVDEASGLWGHINCDEITEFFAAPDNVPPWVTLFTPNGGDTLVKDDEYEISWEAGDDVSLDSVLIEYSIDGGAAYPFVIARPLPHETAYIWTIPDTPSESCLVRVTVYDYSGNASSDVSDSLFTIVQYIGVDEESVGASPQHRLMLGLEGPNPFAGQASLGLSLPGSLAGSEFSLDVFDVAGRHVRTLLAGICPAGGMSRQLIWDAGDQRGARVSSGVYVLLLRANGKPLLTKKLVLLQ